MLAPGALAAGQPRGAGRFAPSPSSDLHLGNLRTALLAWLLATASGRRFLVRVEDLDQQRSAAAPGIAERQLADLAAIGLSWSPPVLHQSARTQLYREAAARLDSYECFCTRAEIAAASRAPHGDLRPYPGTCARLSQAQRSRLRELRRPAIRVRAAGVRATAFDVHAGPVSAMVDDFVLFRADGTPAYNLAVVVDDGEQGVDQVVRGRDLLASSPRQVWLAGQLGYPAPHYAHVGLVLNPQGQRLAKRHGDVTLRAAQHRGVDAAALLGLLARSCGLPEVARPQELLSGLPEGVLPADSPAWADWTVSWADLTGP